MAVSSTTRMIAAILVIAVVAVVGTAFIHHRYNEVQRFAALTQTAVFRNALAVQRDLRRLDVAISSLPKVGPLSDEDFDRVARAIDFLYVRYQAMTDVDNYSPETDADPSAVVVLIETLISDADQGIGEGVRDPAAFAYEITLISDAIHAALIDFVDAQYRRQSESTGQQIAILEQVTLVSLALLWVFAVISSVTVVLYQRQLLTQARRKAAEDKANFLAYFDPMSGLPNRTRFRQVAEEMFAANEDPTVLLFDLDDFKMVNDLYGHAAGDAVLARVAACISEVVTELNGVAARLGGDEFAAVLPGPMSSMRIAAICEQLILDAGEPFDAEGAQISPKLSIGVAFGRSLETSSPPSLSQVQKAADVALYRAKEQGKCTYAFFDADLAQLVKRRRELERGISEALDGEGFMVALQPQIDLQTGHIKGFEALARWKRDGEMISPGEFIPVAEATGQVVDIDIWGLRKSTQMVADWIRGGAAPVTISTNLSPLHFRTTAIVEQVAGALFDSGLPPHLLTLEITESVLIDDVSQVSNILERLRSLGVQLALDDFGTGYSSLSYLRKLNVDIIKIDQSFVRDLERTGETKVIIQALVDIAKGMNKKLVVEGIETDEQCTIIRELGCNYGQGYLFGRPLWETDARAMVPDVDDLAVPKIG